MNKLLLSLVLAALAMALVGCNAGETPVVEVQTQRTNVPSNSGSAAPNVPESARGNIPSNAMAPPPPGGK